MNGRYKKGVTIPRAEQKTDKHKFDVSMFDLYGPTGIANINGVDDVLEDRCITIIMKRGLNEELLDKNVALNDKIWSDIQSNLYELMLTVETSRFHGDEGKLDGAKLIWLTNQLFKKDFSANSAISEGLLDIVTTDEIKTVMNLFSISKSALLALRSDPSSSLYELKNINVQTPPNTALLALNVIKGRLYELFKPLLVLATATGLVPSYKAMVNMALRLALDRKVSDAVESPHLIVMRELIKKFESDGWFKIKKLSDYFYETDLNFITSNKIGWIFKSFGFNKKRHLAAGREYFLEESEIRALSSRLNIDFDEVKKEAKVEEEAISQTFDSAQVMFSKCSSMSCGVYECRMDDAGRPRCKSHWGLI